MYGGSIWIASIDLYCVLKCKPMVEASANLSESSFNPSRRLESECICNGRPSGQRVHNVLLVRRARLCVCVCVCVCVFVHVRHHGHLTRSLPRDVYLCRKNDHPGGQGRIFYTFYLNFVSMHLSKPGH